MNDPMSCTERSETIHRVGSQPIVKVLCGAKEHGMAEDTAVTGKESNQGSNKQQADNTKRVEGQPRDKQVGDGGKRQIDRDGE